jgi:hypothetical protein
LNGQVVILAKNSQVEMTAVKHLDFQVGKSAGNGSSTMVYCVQSLKPRRRQLRLVESLDIATCGKDV